MTRESGWIGKAVALALLSGTAAVVALPALSQESLLPPGFESPPRETRPREEPRPREERPRTPTPAPAPSPAPAPAPTAAPAPGAGPVVARPSGGGAVDAPTTAPAAPAAPTVLRDDLGRPIDAEGNLIEPEGPRYVLPAGSRRSLDRIGPLTPETGGLAPDAFGDLGGRYLAEIMRETNVPLVSRWGHILLRRTLLSAIDTPRTIHGADLTAARALLLSRMGEAVAARMMVQSVDANRATPALHNAAMQVYLANADPAGLCSHVPFMAGTRGADASWELAQAMCKALEGEAGTAAALIERARRRGIAPTIDITLAQKVIGAGLDGRRAAQVQWDGVERLTSWRFALATATGVAIPDRLWTTATPAMRRWAVQAPMIPLQDRMPFAPVAASSGVLSSSAYVDLVSLAATADEPAPAIEDAGRALRAAFVTADRGARIAAILGFAAPGNAEAYAGMVLTARAAARVTPADDDDAEQARLLAAMFAGGLDRNAMGWVRNTRVGSAPWGLLAVGSPLPLVGVDAGDVDGFADDDDSPDQLRTKFLAAALIGLARIGEADGRQLAADYGLNLGRQTRWTRAIDAAATRGEQGTVALLAAVGLQGRAWADLPPYHLYHITAALRRVGLEAEARMIAAEALSRV